MRFSVEAPKGTWLTSINPSPDGRNLLMRVVDERGDPRLWVRSVATGSLKELDGTADAFNQFWSSDGQWIGFFSRSKLLKVPANGSSSPIEIAGTPSWGGATWGADGTILFAPSWDTPIYGVSEKGGMPEPVTTLEPGEASHVWGYHLGDGRLLFGVAMKQAGGRKDEEGIYVQTPGETARKLVLRINPFTLSLSSKGLLTYTDDPPKITVRRFDQKTHELKDPEEYGLPSQVQNADISDDLRVFAQIDKGPESLRTATWYDRSGKVIGTIGEPGNIESPAISPDETHVALEYARDGVQEIRNYEVRRGIATSVHKSEVKWRQIWSPDGRSIVFALQTEPGKSDIVQVSADGTGAATTLVKGEHYATPMSISRDGRWLVFASDSAKDPPTTAGSKISRIRASHGD